MSDSSTPPLTQRPAHGGPPDVAEALPGRDRAAMRGRPPGPHRSLGAYLLVFALVLLGPALGLGAVATWQTFAASQREFETRLNDTARALALALDSELQVLEVAALGLASAPSLRQADADTLAAQRDWVAEFAAAAGANQVIILDAAPGYQQWLNTALPETQAPSTTPGTVVVQTIRRAIETRRPAVSDLFLGRRTGLPRIAVLAPVLQEERVDHLVMLLLPPDHFSRILEAQMRTSLSSAALADASGRMVARSQDAERFIGRPMPAFYAATEGRPEGIYRGANAAGEMTVFGFRRLQRAPGWGVVVGEPQSAQAATARAALLLLGGGALAAIILGSLAAWRLATGILRPIAALRRQAHAVATGTPDALTGPEAEMPSAIGEFVDLRAALVRAHAALQAGETRLRVAIEAARFSTWEFDVRRGLGSRQGELAERLPTVPGAGFGLEDWIAQLHPDDRPAARAAFEAVLAGRQATFGMEFRVAAPGGGWLWVASHGAPVERDPASGRVLRIAGVAQDVTERRSVEERQALLTRELDHRAKNALTVVQAALRLTPRDDPARYAAAVEGRVLALARAHTLLADSRWRGADLRGLVEGELAPFLVQGDATAPRAELDGPAVTLPPAATQPLSMALHELATNAMKYGALSVPGGRVLLRWQVTEGLLRLHWSEHGGPPLEGEPTRRGFGTRVLQATIAGQLGGTVVQAWPAGGLACDLAFTLHPAPGPLPPA